MTGGEPRAPCRPYATPLWCIVKIGCIRRLFEYFCETCISAQKISESPGNRSERLRNGQVDRTAFALCAGAASRHAASTRREIRRLRGRHSLRQPHRQIGRASCRETGEAKAAV